MKKFTITFFALVLLCGCVSSEKQVAHVSSSSESKISAQENLPELFKLKRSLNKPSVDLWNGAQVGNRTTLPEIVRGKYALGNISEPRLELFLLDNGRKDNGFVIICPGGGYAFLNGKHEGYDIAKYLNDAGVSAAVLWYRAPDNRKGALQDAQRAIRLARANAEKWNINPDKIAIMGFSAGAHLSAVASARFDKPSYKPVDGIDKLSARPDHTILIYPAYIDKPMFQCRWVQEILEDFPSIDYNHDYEISEHLFISKDTPPAFIVQTQDDRVCKNSSLAYFLALKKAGVDATLFMCEKGGHGYSLCAQKKDLLVSLWGKILIKYLGINGYVK